jgi:hypothetical protein
MFALALAIPAYATGGGHQPPPKPSPTPNPPTSINIPIIVQAPSTNENRNNIHVKGGNQFTHVNAAGGEGGAGGAGGHGGSVNVGPGGLSPSATAIIEKGAVENNNTITSSSESNSKSNATIGDIKIDASQEAPKRVAPPAPSVSLAQPMPGYIQTEGQKFANIGSLHRDFNYAALSGGGLGEYAKSADTVGPALATLIFHSNWRVVKQGDTKPRVWQAFVGPNGTTDMRRLNVLGSVLIQAKPSADSRTVNFSQLKELLLDYVCEKFRGAGEIAVVFSFNDLVYTVGTETKGRSTGVGGGFGAILGLVTPTVNGGKSDTDSTVIPFAALGTTVYVVSTAAYREELASVVLSELFPPTMPNHGQRHGN